MFGSLTMTTRTNYTNSNIVVETYKNNKENLFKATQPPKKQHKTLQGLLQECPLLGQVQHGSGNFIA